MNVLVCTYVCVSVYFVCVFVFLRCVCTGLYKFQRSKQKSVPKE